MSEGGATSPDLSRGGDTLPVDLSNDAFDLAYPREQTDACENITFPQLRLRAVNVISMN